MDTQQVGKDSATHSRRAYLGWWLGLGIVVVLAVVVHFVYRPARALNAASPVETIAVTQDESGSRADVVSRIAPRSALPRELVEMEAAGLVTLARPAALPRELVEMEAAGLVTLARPAAPPAPRPSLPRELVEMEAAGLVTLARP